jgi:phospholipid transport system transporter-binding protein
VAGKATIEATAADVASISGDMNFQTVQALSESAEGVLGKDSTIRQLDLAGVKHVDSSGLALLLEWQSLIKQKGHAFQIIHAPDDLVSLARLCEAQELLQLHSRGATDQNLNENK